MNGDILKLCNINTKFLEILMTRIFFQVHSSVQSPAEGISEELRN
jgi:hypothetical protein